MSLALTRINWARLIGFGCGVGLGLAAVLLLSGCAGSPRWGAWSNRPTVRQIETALGRQDRFVYIPGYELYYHGGQARYVFREGDEWVSSAEPPPAVSVATLLASPSVVVTFSDEPERHHVETARAYPRNWGKPDGEHVAAR